MRIVLDGETHILAEMAGDGFEIASDGVAISAYHLLAASLASCTALTVPSWAGGADVGTDRLAIDVQWEFSDEQPKRVARIWQPSGGPTSPSAASGPSSDCRGSVPSRPPSRPGPW